MKRMWQIAIVASLLAGLTPNVASAFGPHTLEPDVDLVEEADEPWCPSTPSEWCVTTYSKVHLFEDDYVALVDRVIYRTDDCPVEIIVFIDMRVDSEDNDSREEGFEAGFEEGYHDGLNEGYSMAKEEMDNEAETAYQEGVEDAEKEMANKLWRYRFGFLVLGALILGFAYNFARPRHRR